MRMRSLLFALVGGIVGAAIVVGVLFALGDLQTGTQKTVVEQVTQGGPAPASGVSTPGLTPAQIYQKDAKSVVEIVSTFPGQATFFGNTGATQGIGSGFVVSSDGYILTNAHVVVDFEDSLNGSAGINASAVSVIFKGSGKSTKTVSAKVIGVDASDDVALVKVDPAKAPTLYPILLGDSSTVQVGEPVVAIGNPLGYDFSLSAGVISATGRTIDSPNGYSINGALQTDAAINPGNSGGPLIDPQGAVVGINDQIATQSGGNEGLGFAVPIDTALSTLKQLRANGGISWLGISGLTITADLAKAVNLSVNRGVLVEQVVAHGPAAKAGIRAGSTQATIGDQTLTLGGDIITAIGGTQITSMQQLAGLVSKEKPGTKVSVTVLRMGKTLQLTVTLALRPANQ